MGPWCTQYRLHMSVIQYCDCMYIYRNALLMSRPGTHTWVLHSNQGPTLGSFIQTRDPHLGLSLRPGTHAWVLHSTHLGPSFKPWTHTWVLRLDQGPTLGSFIQTMDAHLGPSFRPGTHTWFLHSNQGRTLGSFV